MKVLDLPKMYNVINMKGLQDFVGIMFKCKVVCLVWARERKDGIVTSRYFFAVPLALLSLGRERKEEKALSCMSASNYISLKHKL